MVTFSAMLRLLKYASKLAWNNAAFTIIRVNILNCEKYMYIKSHLGH